MIVRKPKSLILGIGTFVAATFGASALATLTEEADELFELTGLDDNVLTVTGAEGDGDGEGECGEGKCGEGKCGEGKCGEGDDEDSDDEGEEEGEEG